MYTGADRGEGVHVPAGGGRGHVGEMGAGGRAQRNAMLPAQLCIMHACMHDAVCKRTWCQSRSALTGGRARLCAPSKHLSTATPMAMVGHVVGTNSSAAPAIVALRLPSGADTHAALARAHRTNSCLFLWSPGCLCCCCCWRARLVAWHCAHAHMRPGSSSDPGGPPGAPTPGCHTPAPPPLPHLGHPTPPLHLTPSPQQIGTPHRRAGAPTPPRFGTPLPPTHTIRSPPLHLRSLAPPPPPPFRTRQAPMHSLALIAPLPARTHPLCRAHPLYCTAPAAGQRHGDAGH